MEHRSSDGLAFVRQLVRVIPQAIGGQTTVFLDAIRTHEAVLEQRDKVLT